MCSAHFWKRIFEKMYFEKNDRCYIFWAPKPKFWAVTQVVKTKKARSAVVISFQVVSHRDGCSKVHSRWIWYWLGFDLIFV